MPPLMAFGQRPQQLPQEIQMQNNIASTSCESGGGVLRHDDQHTSLQPALDTGASAPSGTGQQGHPQHNPNNSEELLEQRKQMAQMLAQMQTLATKVEEAAERASRGSFKSCNDAEDVSLQHRPEARADGSAGNSRLLCCSMTS